MSEFFAASLTAIASYLATSLDELPLLFLYYAGARRRGALQVTLGYFGGTLALLLISLAGGLGLQAFVPARYLRWIGLIPLGLGVWRLFKGEQDEQEDQGQASRDRGWGLGAGIFLLTLSLGTDDLAVYLPLFASLGGSLLALVFALQLVDTAAFALIAYRLTRIEPLQKWIESRGRWIEGGIFALVGLYILLLAG